MVYVSSFPYLFYTLIKLCGTKTERSSFITGPGLNSSPLEAKNPGIFHGLSTAFQPFVIHIESSFQIEDAFRGVAILSLSVAMEYVCMCLGHVSALCRISSVPGLLSSLHPWQSIVLMLTLLKGDCFFKFLFRLLFASVYR